MAFRASMLESYGIEGGRFIVCLEQAIEENRPTSCLVYGPQGCGKSWMVEKVLNHFEHSPAYGTSIEVHRLVGWLTATKEEQLDQLEKIKTRLRVIPFLDSSHEKESGKTHIVFLDAIDWYLPAKGWYDRHVLLHFKQTLARLNEQAESRDSRQNVIFISAALDISSIALPLQHLFQHLIQLELPSQSQRKHLMNSVMQTLGIHDAGAIPPLTPRQLDILSQSTQGLHVGDLSRAIQQVSNGLLTNDQASLEKEPFFRGLMDAVKSKRSRYPSASSASMTSNVPSLPVLTEDGSTKAASSAVIGHDQIIETLGKAIAGITDAEARKPYEMLGVAPPTGILLYGPPGTGKTLIAKTLANASGLAFLNVKCQDLVHAEIGASEKAIARWFQYARKHRPCMLFFDEIEALFPTCAGKDGSSDDDNSSDSEDDSETPTWHRQFLATLTHQFDQLKAHGIDSVVVMAATNFPERIDHDLLMSGRLDNHYFIPPFGQKERFEFLMQKLAPQMEEHQELREYLYQTAIDMPPFSGAEIAQVCKLARGMALNRSLKRATEGEAGPPNEWVHPNEIKQAIDIVSTRTDDLPNRLDVRRYTRWARRMGA